MSRNCQNCDLNAEHQVVSRIYGTLLALVCSLGLAQIQCAGAATLPKKTASRKCSNGEQTAYGYRIQRDAKSRGVVGTDIVTLQTRGSNWLSWEPKVLAIKKLAIMAYGLAIHADPIVNKTRFVAEQFSTTSSCPMHNYPPPPCHRHSSSYNRLLPYKMHQQPFTIISPKTNSTHQNEISCHHPTSRRYHKSVTELPAPKLTPKPSLIQSPTTPRSSLTTLQWKHNVSQRRWCRSTEGRTIWPG